MPERLSPELMKRVTAVTIGNEMRRDRAPELTRPNEGQIGRFADDEPDEHAAMRTPQVSDEAAEDAPDE